MLQFFVEPKLHDDIREEMVDQIPAGQFYLQSIGDMVPRSTLPTRFVLITDTNAPVDIWVNGDLQKTHIPRGERDVVELFLDEPPANNNIKVENGVDAPVSLTATATYITTFMDAIASQLYSVAGRINDKYFDLFTSPWAAFIIEWLIPWPRELPDVRSFRAMSLKMAANTMVGESGLEGGVRDMVSVFTSTTPAVVESWNPTQWQPEIYQPYTSADDLLSWDFNIWLPNICLRRWLAFTRLVANTDQHDFVRYDENVAMLRQRGTGSEYYQQHLFDNTGPTCSLRGLLSAIGCLDNLVVAGTLEFTAEPSFCFWAHPFDMQVEYPGIGGRFFDSGPPFDTAGHVRADDTNRVLADFVTTQAEAVTLATEIRTDYNAHDTDASPTWHYAAGGAHQITAAVPSDLPTLRTFCIDLQTVYAAHLADAAMHNPVDTINGLSSTITATSTLDDVLVFLNDFKHKFLAHQTAGNFDSLYDLDLATDFWVGASLSKKLDGGGCFDSYTTTPLPTKDQECCVDGPDTKLFATVRFDNTVVSAVKPNHPVFGGDDPGILPDPYFGVLE